TQIFPFVVMMPLWVLSVTAAVDVGFLLGIHLFKQVSLVMLIETILLLVITVILVEAEQPNYLYVAIPLSSLVAFGFNWYLAQSQPQKPIKSTKSIQPTFPWKFYFHSLVSKFAAVTFITVDVLLAKYFLPPEEAGLYTIISVVGKMLYYATSLLGQFVVPLVS